MSLTKQNSTKLQSSDSDWLEQHQNILEKAGYPVPSSLSQTEFDSNQIFAPWERVQVGDHISNSTE
jgi:hypothetical protein